MLQSELQGHKRVCATTQRNGAQRHLVATVSDGKAGCRSPVNQRGGRGWQEQGKGYHSSKRLGLVELQERPPEDCCYEQSNADARGRIAGGGRGGGGVWLE